MRDGVGGGEEVGAMKKKKKKKNETDYKPMHQFSRSFVHKDSIFYRLSFLSRWTICIWGVGVVKKST